MDFELYRSSLICAVNSIDNQTLENIVALIDRTLSKNKNIFIAGNGGSYSNAEHMSCDLESIAQVKGTSSIIISVQSNTSKLTACSNDIDYSEFLKKEVSRTIQRDDLIIIFSVSGESQNIVRLLESLPDYNYLLLLGEGKGNACQTSQRYIVNVSSKNYGIVESVHAFLSHYICDSLRKVATKSC